ncbi:hypothetical protein [Schinkia azotoformans]|uniref:hypothetical protein n=1 Tax=Schinkia azotoformans TaxID=1454 RepID=UPI002DBF40D8|nr:hypothetical protein [Schinkia azotoformans]MEC1722834.1 hypothetical protein [Schinkia azotoformans]MED4414268.1 hypothetical protein [Schinkia azotoformans]
MGKIIEIERNYEDEFHHNLWTILKREIDEKPEFMGWYRKERVIKLNEELYKLTEFKCYVTEVSLTLKPFTGDVSKIKEKYEGEVDYVNEREMG